MNYKNDNEPRPNPHQHIKKLHTAIEKEVEKTYFDFWVFLKKFIGKKHD